MVYELYFCTSMIQSRLVQNLAFDKILPEKFAKITPNDFTVNLYR